MPNPDVAYGQDTLVDGIRSRHVDNGNGLNVHLLEAGAPNRPCVLLLHGFPELAYSWRHILLPIAELGYHVVAPDQRGYGHTTGWSSDYDTDLRPFALINLVRDAIGVVHATGHEKADVVGHDFGSPVAAWCALIRPDIFRSVVMMSSPFGGSPPLSAQAPTIDIHEDLAELSPPRKHYQWYYTTPEAERDMLDCEQGVHDFLRAYYHHKSSDWEANQPYPLESSTAKEIARLPTYYVMEKDQTMPQTVSPEMPSKDVVDACRWLPDASLNVYSETFARTGFQGGLQWYRCSTGGESARDLRTFTGRTIDVPSAYIAGKHDWGTYQKPGSYEAMQSRACSDFRGSHLIPEAGHWVQQEQPGYVVEVLTDFLRG